MKASLCKIKAVIYQASGSAGGILLTNIWTVSIVCKRRYSDKVVKRNRLDMSAANVPE
jgi:hypothetical protein